MDEIKEIIDITPEQGTELSPKVKEAIMVHQSIIHHASEAVSHLYDMGKQLKAMRDGKLYKYLGFETFGGYVENNGEYSFKERQAYKYIKIVETYSGEFIAENQHLGVERLEMLSALGERDAAEVVEKNDIAEMSAAKVRQLVKEKQGLGEQLSLLTDEMTQLKAETSNENEKHRQEIEKSKAKIKDLEEELKKSKEAAEESKREIRKQALEQAKEEQSKEIATLKADYEERLRTSEDKMQALERKIQTGSQDESRAALKVYFEETQKNIKTFIDKIGEMPDPEQRKRFANGAVKWLGQVIAELESIK